MTVYPRVVWMRETRIQGSHVANLLQASQANNLVVERRIDPCMSEVFAWRDIPRAHTKMMKNQHRPGNMAVLVQAKRPGLRTLEDAAAAASGGGDIAIGNSPPGSRPWASSRQPPPQTVTP